MHRLYTPTNPVPEQSALLPHSFLSALYPGFSRIYESPTNLNRDMLSLDIKKKEGDLSFFMIIFIKIKGEIAFYELC